RPRTLDEFVGQERIVGPGRLLRRAIQADQLSSVIFYGPPGTGKTTLARVIANTTKADFLAINAVLAGVKDIREAVARAQATREAGRRTILFVDEVHRFNKAQQDALLPWVENGTVILIGATTENPYFEVNKALLSRSRVFELTPLDEDDLREVARQALADPERGYGGRDVVLDEDALDHLVNVANGDARALLNALELAVETTPPGDDGVVRVTRAVAEESIQRRAVLYDKEGDAHFDTISAFIKSVRGSDPDAALYWLAKMVYAGEDPRFIMRRLLVLASEDVGLADPQALGVVAAAAQALDYVGLPEGRFHLAQATLYLATAPKSNSTMAFFDALAAVEREREAEVPDHLKDANRDAEGFGHGEGYLYPHAYRDHWVAQQYLPDALQGTVFYQPSAMGHEATVRDEVMRRREAQVAAMAEAEEESRAPRGTARRPLPERSVDRWLERTVSRAGERLAIVRDHLFALAGVRRDDLVLDLAAGTGLLTWEALRRAPNGQVWALAATEREATAMEQAAAALPELQRPVVVRGAPAEAAARVADAARRQGDEAPAFDLVIGRGALGGDPAAVLAQAATLLASGGRLVLAEVDRGAAQRLHRLVDLGDPDLAARVRAAEEEVYAGERVDDEALLAAARAAGLEGVRLERRRLQTRETLPRRTVEAWFERGAGRPSYADHLATRLTGEEVERVRRAFVAQLADAEAPWEATYYFLAATRG
ncbi:MAG TPA: AAA family ATPase, partial [Trueperaceae bacterium]|nr:AAA family ATPase [Trueperaceae bacterium]